MRLGGTLTRRGDSAIDIRIRGVVFEYCRQRIGGGVPLMNWRRHTAKYPKQVIPMAAVVDLKNGFVVSDPIAEKAQSSR